MFACRPFREAGGTFILTVKPSSNKMLHGHVASRDARAKRRTTVTGKKRKVIIDHSRHWVDDVPMRGGKGAMKGTRVHYPKTNRNTGTTTRTARFTDLEVDRRNVEEIITCGAGPEMARENEGFNVLRNQGQHMEDSFGHGKENLASVLLVLSLLAFRIHAGCKWRSKARKEAGIRWATGRDFFNALRSFLCKVLFGNWDGLLGLMTSDEGIPCAGQSVPPP